jgi:putative hydrolase of the HAD superfamily
MSLQMHRTPGRAKAVLFDLGNTLVRYFERSEFPAILEQAILQVRGYLQEEGLLAVSAETMWSRVRQENHESRDHRVRPLEERLGRIFEIEPGRAMDRARAMCWHFTRPIFACSRCYEDALPALQQLRAEGIKTALVSNTPWGSPAALWREELARLGLTGWLDVDVFCTDVGWRKPASPIFEHALALLGTGPQDCLFVGDDPRWDLAGARAVGIEAVLIDRREGMPGLEEGSIQNLYELWDKL